MRIALCGSISASVEMNDLEERLTGMGHVVTVPLSASEYKGLEEVERIKRETEATKLHGDLIRGYAGVIERSDAIIVVNVPKNGIEGYIGANTFLEMGFAHEREKDIYTLYALPDMEFHRDEIRAMDPLVLDGDLDLFRT